MTKKTNKQKFQAMDRKQKIEYIWEYYRWHIVATLVAIFAVAEIFRIATLPKPDFKIHTVVAGQVALDPDQQEKDQATFYEMFGSDLQFIPVDWEAGGQATLSAEQLLNLKIQVRELDVMVLADARHKIFLQIDRFDPFVKLDEIPELAPLLEKYQDQLVKGNSRIDGKEHVFGIKVREVNGLPGTVLGEEFVISLVEPPKDMETAIKVIEYLLQ
ncbi:MAG: hypothetical protein ACRCTE_10335 [Cellulosilyticaceae bacterium]